MTVAIKGFGGFNIREPLTNRIKGILDEYPDGTQIARELLQNSDDARSKVQWYLLDHHDRRPESAGLRLYHQALAEYTGPALLAGNDSLFEEKDFTSMQNLAASEKKTDETKIGQMGIGFNSIYHMTDCPSFISGDQLVVIEPHERIFRDQESGYPQCAVRGQFVENLAVFPDQLKLLAALENIDFTKPYPGTIFRFPLRTEAQAKTSRMSGNAYPADKVHDMLMKLKEEALKGILFLKHIERIVIYERKEHEETPTKLFEIEFLNAKEVQQERQRLLANLKEHVYPDPSASRDTILEYSVRPVFKLTQKDGSSTQEIWNITTMVGNVMKAHERMAKLSDGDLKSHKLIPWVGIAAPAEPGVMIDSARLFCFLPIGIQLPFPVHINGHFAVKQSRREIWTNQDNDFASNASAYIKSAWNVHLFQEQVPIVYAKFLANLGLVRGADYQLWPLSCGVGLGLDAIWKHLLRDVLRVVCTEGLKVFFCRANEEEEYGLIDYQSSWIAGRDLDEHKHLLETLQGFANVVIELPDPILKTLPGVIKSLELEDRILTPALVRKLLREHKDHWSSAPSKETRVDMLKYCIKDGDIADLQGLPLLPLAGDVWVEFDTQQASDRFHVSPQVFQVLSYSNEGLVDLKVDKDLVERFKEDKLFENFWSEMSTSIIGTRIKDIYGRLCYGQDCSKSIPKECITQSHDTFPTNKWLHNFWDMAHFRHHQTKELLSMLKGIHIIPITRDRLAPLDLGLPVVYADRDRCKEEPTLKPFFKVLDEELDCRAMRSGFAISDRVAGSYVFEVSNASVVLGVVARVSPEKLQLLKQDHRQSALDYMARWLPADHNLSEERILALGSMPIFQLYENSTLVSLQETDAGEENWKVASRFSMVDYPWLPMRTKLFADEQPLLQHLVNLLNIPTMKESEYWFEILSNLTHYMENDWDSMFEKFCRTYHVHSKDFDFPGILHNLPFVRVSGPSSIDALQKLEPATRLCPDSVINPSLSPYYLDHECVFPSGVYAQSAIFGVLSEMGMQSIFDSALLLDRVRTLSSETQSSNFTKRDSALRALYTRINAVFSFAFQSTDLKDVFRSLPWILAKTLDEDDYLLYNSAECRPMDDLSLVGSQMPLSQFVFTNEALLECMGWKLLPPLEKVLANLQTLIDRSVQSISMGSEPAEDDFLQIYRYLMTHISDSEALSEMKKALDKRPWILVHGVLRTADRVALNLYYDLEPHFVRITVPGLESLFLAMGVREYVEQGDLQSLISGIALQYAEDERLSDTDSDLVIKMLEAISRTQFYNWSPDLLILTDDSRLRKVTDVVFDDVNARKEMPDVLATDSSDISYTFASNKISSYTARELGIPFFSTRCWEDEKDSTFEPWAQQEDIVNRIKTVLNDYDPSNIFTEFLQNAADAGATKCSFMLDRRSFGRKKILSKEMGAWQGPALVIYNNAKFTESDFIALSHLGVGNKREDTSKIGRHGLGFNSVYHFTDVPSVVSGSYIGFFDPCRESLHRTRTPLGHLVSHGGQRSKFQNLKSAALSDQLAPYVGLFGCDMKSDFDGTIFRIPLRTLDSQIRTPNPTTLGDIWTLAQVQEMLQSWAKDANTGMLFLDKMQTIELNDQGSFIWSASKKVGTGNPYIEKALSEGQDPSTSTQIMDIVVVPTPSSKAEIQKWLVHTEFGFPESSSLPPRDLAQKYHWSPHRGIAIPLNYSRNSDQPTGRLFTHLPTPIQTSLPFHIHGVFALTSNRKGFAGGSDIKDEKALWNSFMMHELLPLTAIHAFERFLRWQLRDSAHGGPNSSKDVDYATALFFRFWPLKGRGDSNQGMIDVDVFISRFLRLSYNHPIYPVRIPGQRPPFKGLKGQEIVFPGIIGAPDGVMGAIRGRLQGARVYICDCPHLLYNQVKNEWKGSPALTYRSLNEDELRGLVRLDPKFIPNKITSTEGKKWMLGRTLSVVIDPKAEFVETLRGLALVPLMNGEWKELGVGSTYYTAKSEEKDLISGKDILVDETLFKGEINKAADGSGTTVSNLDRILRRLTKDTNLGIKEMSPDVFAGIICAENPNRIHNDLRGKLWRLLSGHKNLTPFANLPILKTINGSMVRLGEGATGLELSRIPFQFKRQVDKLACLIQDLGFVVFDADDNGRHPYLMSAGVELDARLILKVIASKCSGFPSSRTISKVEAEVLRELIMDAGDELNDSARALGVLRIWKSWEHTSNNQDLPLIPAQGSYFVEGNYSLRNLGRFPDVICSEYCKFFITVGAIPLNAVSAAQNRVIPAILNGSLRCVKETKTAYIDMLSAIVRLAASSKKNNPSKALLLTTPVILARDGSLRTSRELFDPTDQLLQSLFSGEPSKFPETALWSKIHNNKKLFQFRESSEATVLRECALYLLDLTKGFSSLEPTVIREKAASLVRFIYQHPSTLNWMDPQWKIVPVEPVDPSPFNEEGLSLPSSEYMAFSELLDSTKRDITWTQCAFFPETLKPSPEFRKHFPSVGGEQLVQVINHLSALVEILAPQSASVDQQLALKVSLFKVYKALHEYADRGAEEREIVSNMLDSRMQAPYILNGDDKDPSLEESWLWPHQLMLDIDNNMERHQIVHQKLHSVRTFLVAAGVAQMQAVEGMVEVPVGREVGEIESRLLNCFESQDRQNGFMDVLFKFAGGQEILAHRFMLAHANEYFARRFTGAWAEITTRDPMDPSMIVIDLSSQEETYEAFWGLIYFFYADKLIISNGPLIPPSERNRTVDHIDELRDRVQYLMGLQQLANRFDTPRLKALVAFEVVTEKKVIHSNVFQVKSHAMLNQSMDIQDHCEEYLRKNAVSIRTYLNGELQAYRASLSELAGESDGAQRVILRDDIEEFKGYLQELSTLV
ncbi:hypothetical protein BGZ54_007843 [Gamsiella multidivaricata]|nr:hypothetical protein BGZ54_007843 [Gamsiella multidivaricata]